MKNQTSTRSMPALKPVLLSMVRLSSMAAGGGRQREGIRKRCKTGGNRDGQRELPVKLSVMPRRKPWHKYRATHEAHRD